MGIRDAQSFGGIMVEVLIQRLFSKDDLDFLQYFWDEIVGNFFVVFTRRG